jgi:hypothetical protein
MRVQASILIERPIEAIFTCVTSAAFLRSGHQIRSAKICKGVVSSMVSHTLLYLMNIVKHSRQLQLVLLERKVFRESGEMDNQRS